jgi:hypothetical protein
VSDEFATVSFRAESGVTEDESWTVVDSAVLSNTVPWRTFRWYKGQRHYWGVYWSATMRDHVVYESWTTPGGAPSHTSSASSSHPASVRNNDLDLTERSISSPEPPHNSRQRSGQIVHRAWVGDRRAARMAGSSPAAVPMSRVAARPPAQAWGGMTVAQPLAWA